MIRDKKLEWYKKEFEAISKEIENKKELTYCNFLRIRNFKLQNSSVEEEVHINKITKEAFELARKDEIEEAINRLLELHGVAVPIASTILAMKYPEKFAIIDKRVIKSLGKEEWLKNYLKNPKIYREYLLLLRKKAKEKGMKLRDYERSLFEKGK